MAVAPGTAQRQAQEHGASRGDAVGNRFDAELFLVGPTLFVDQRISVKAGGRELFRRRVCEHVAGDLLDRESVERHALVDRPNHPLAILPNRAAEIPRIAVAVGVAGQVEPVAAPALAVIRRGQQSVNDPLVSIRRCILLKRGNVCRRRQQADQI